jgi:hypothetical protein
MLSPVVAAVVVDDRDRGGAYEQHPRQTIVFQKTVQHASLNNVLFPTPGGPDTRTTCDAGGPDQIVASSSMGCGCGCDCGCHVFGIVNFFTTCSNISISSSRPKNGISSVCNNESL